MTLPERWEAAFKALGAERVEHVQSLTSLGQTASSVVVADGSAVAEHASLEVLKDCTCGGTDAVLLVGAGMGESPVIVLGSGAVRAASSKSPASYADLIAAVRSLAESGEVVLRRLEVASPFWRRISDRRSASRSTWEMLKRLRLRPGGLVARGVNRHVSIRLTGLVLPFRVTPNHMTTVAGIVGLAATAAMLQGGYLWAVVGAALMEFSSILDGCDGEIAKIKYQSSDFGGWYDSIWDEFVNSFFLAAVGWNLSGAYGHPVLLWMGVFSGAASLLYAAAHWHSKFKHGVGLYWWFDQGKPRKVVWESRSPLSILKKLFWRDSFLFIYFVAAVLWYPLPLLLAVSTAGSIGVFALLFYHILVKRARW